ncbi:single-stranded DNA-binding protein [Burkholderia sp. Bp9142]|uniref:single-stranded DNA-binding protein n=1 Tax=Burkholderia sp. Bp9142 TaxID=2184573 RepID=UPI000F59EB13|nr:single-stranded DNA-binding protein [Burkholderia sp. Bp9142]RQR34808.1 single-strand-binding protein/primosomal replication protein n [Burkholderia sp. Bp9142]
MQAFGNVGSDPVKKISKSTGKPYWELRLCESQRGVDSQPTWYSVRIMRDVNPNLVKGDFVKVTGKLKADFYLSREGKPTGTLLILAFEAAKIAKPVTAGAESATA